MKITKGKIILLIVVVYFIVFAIINVNKEKDINKQILDKVTYVTDGKINKKNEGKLVLVTGKVGYDKLVSFIELPEDFGTIKISRKVEDYVKEYDEDSKEYEYDWEERKKPLNNESDNYLERIVSEEKTSNVTIGEFKLDKKGLDLIPTRIYAKAESIGELTTTGIAYERDPWEEDLKEGDIKLSYQYYDIKKNPYITVLAIQRGDSFEPYEVDKKSSVYRLYVGKINTKEKLAKQLKTHVKSTIKGKTLFILMILGIGIFFIVDNRKNRKVENEK